MGIIQVNTPEGLVDVKISGTEPTPQEQQRIIDGFEEDFYDFLESEGWNNSDTYYYAHADSLDFEREDD